MSLPILNWLPLELRNALNESPIVVASALATALLLVVWIVLFSSPPSSRRAKAAPVKKLGAVAALSSRSANEEQESPMAHISSATVRADFNDARAVAHYSAAVQLGLWVSEREAVRRAFRHLLKRASLDDLRLLECGCGAGRVSIALCSPAPHDAEWRPLSRMVAFDFAESMCDTARRLVAARGLSDRIEVLSLASI